MSTAHDRVRNQLGSALASKCSPRLLGLLDAITAGGPSVTADVAPGRRTVFAAEPGTDSPIGSLSPAVVPRPFPRPLPGSGARLWNVTGPTGLGMTLQVPAAIHLLAPAATVLTGSATSRGAARRQRADWLRNRGAELEDRCAEVIARIRSDERWFSTLWPVSVSADSPPNGIYLSPLTGSLQGVVDAYTLAEVAADERVGLVDELDEYLTEAARGVRTGDVLPHDWSGCEFGSQGRGVTVAVVDAGVGATHPAFGARATQYGDYTDDGHVYPDPHGTFVAGLIGADSPVGRGVAPECDLHLYKVQSLVRTRRILGTQVERALADAAANGADIVNCSFGVAVPRGGLLLEAAITQLIQLGITVVKSAGNDGPEPFSRPCESPGLVVAGAWDTDADGTADYSSRGPVGTRLAPDLHAPGGTDRHRLRGLGTADGAASSGIGTSFAAALVTGAAAAVCGGSSGPMTPAATLAQLAGSARVAGNGLRVLF